MNTAISEKLLVSAIVVIVGLAYTQSVYTFAFAAPIV